MTYTCRCKECDATLWSEASKKKGVCPECLDTEETHSYELESCLEWLEYERRDLQ